MPRRRPINESRRRLLVAVLIILMLAFWTGFRLYTTGQLESIWNPSVGTQVAIQSPGPSECVPEYAELRLLGGMYTPISEQTPQLREETCLVGCWDEHMVRSYSIVFDEDRQAHCSCDLNDCEPKELPAWYFAS